MPIFYFCMFWAVTILSIYTQKTESQIMQAYNLFEDRRDHPSPFRCELETFLGSEQYLWKKQSLAWIGETPCLPPRTDYASPSDGYKKLPPALCILAEKSGIRNLEFFALPCALKLRVK